MLLYDRLRFVCRIDWLKQGSRELFGTVVESQIYILIDTSASMQASIEFVKDKLLCLMQVCAIPYQLSRNDSSEELVVCTVVCCRTVLCSTRCVFLVLLSALLFSGATASQAEVQLGCVRQQSRVLEGLLD